MPRFVILEHVWNGVHWDFLLEDAGKLLSWELAKVPSAGAMMKAKPKPDHRLTYLEYEGGVSGNRGHVTRWDAGTFEWIERNKAFMRVHLHGEKLQSIIEATYTQSEWVFTFNPPEEV